MLDKNSNKLSKYSKLYKYIIDIYLITVISNKNCKN